MDHRCHGTTGPAGTELVADGAMAYRSRIDGVHRSYGSTGCKAHQAKMEQMVQTGNWPTGPAGLDGHSATGPQGMTGSTRPGRS